MSCCICLEDLNSPVSLPCGHVFCYECLKRAVQVIRPYSTLHTCPTCRMLYFITPLDISTVPLHLRPHITPSIRKVYLDLPPKDTNSGPKTSPLNTATLDSSKALSLEVARLRAEVEALKYNCSMWRRRAEAHSSTTIGLLKQCRAAKDQFTRTCRERDTIQRNYLELNYDFQRQRSILQAVVSTTMPPCHLGSPSGLSQPRPFVNPPASDSELVPPQGSYLMEQGGRKRLWQEDDDRDSAIHDLRSRPAKTPRRVITDNSPSVHQIGKETS